MLHIGQVVPVGPGSYSWPNYSDGGPYYADCGMASVPFNSFVGFQTERGLRVVLKYVERSDALLQDCVRLDAAFESEYQSPTYLAGVGAMDLAIANLGSEIHALSYFARRELRAKEAQLRELRVAKDQACGFDKHQPLSIKVFEPGALRADEQLAFTAHLPDLWVDMLFDSMFDGWFYVSLLQSCDRCLRDARGSLGRLHGDDHQELAAAINLLLAG